MDKSVRKDWIERLSVWQDLHTFKAIVDDCNEALGSFGPMIHHGTGFWRDARIASEFGRSLQAQEIRLLHPEPYPDFALRNFGVQRLFEATEAMRPGRRRADEFRDDLGAIVRGEIPVRDDPEVNWLTPESAFQMLKTCADKKAVKPYAATCGLVIYLNESWYGDDKTEILQSFRGATVEAGKVFQTVHVIWQTRTIAAWP